MLSVLRSRPTLLHSSPAALRRVASTSASPSKTHGLLRRSWESYTQLLETQPLATKIITGGAIAAVGDVSCQLFLEVETEAEAGEQKGDEHHFDFKRATIFTLLGGFLVSPLLHVWYGFLGARVPGTSWGAVAKRLALDQLVFAPSFLPIFFSSVLTLEGQPERIPAKLRADWWPATQTNWSVWVPAQLINFRVVPGSLQVLFSNIVGLFWNSYLSYVSHLKTESAAALEAQDAAGEAAKL